MKKHINIFKDSVVRNPSGGSRRYVIVSLVPNFLNNALAVPACSIAFNDSFLFSHLI